MNSYIKIRECTSNEYGRIYEFFPPVNYTLHSTELPNGLEIRYNKKYANWKCNHDDETKINGKIQGVCSAIEHQLQDSIYWKKGFYTVYGGDIVLETQPFPRITTHKLFRHQPGEIWTYENLRPGFKAKDVVIECKHVHVNDGGHARLIWYMKSITPDCVYERIN